LALIRPTFAVFAIASSRSGAIRLGKKSGGDERAVLLSPIAGVRDFDTRTEKAQQMTPLDQAHARMQADPDNSAVRLQFYARLLDAELFLLLETEPSGDNISPMVFPTGGQSCVLVFDKEVRLAEFTRSVSPFAAMSGRKIIAMLVGQDLGLGLNFSVAPSEILLSAETIAWLGEMLTKNIKRMTERPARITAPRGLGENLIRALDAKLAITADLAKSACLVGVTYEGGRQGNLLAIIGAPEAAQSAMADAVSEALAFTGEDGTSLDVAFFEPDDSIVKSLETAGLRFDLPQQAKHTPRAPGMDPSMPPDLR